MDALEGWKLPVRRVRVDESFTELDRTAYPATIPAVAQLLKAGELEIGPITVLIGENGSGKSTLIEAIAQAFGLSPEGGTPFGRHSTRVTESPLNEVLRIERGVGGPKWGFFLRAETMHGLYTFLEENPGAHDPKFHEVSHGESFLAVLESRFDSPGLYVLDEPESALSFSGCLSLIGALLDLTADGRSQVVMATHSPVLAAIPGARILQLDDSGFAERTWDDLELVDHYRRFLARPEAYLRHLRP